MSGEDREENEYTDGLNTTEGTGTGQGVTSETGAESSPDTYAGQLENTTTEVETESEVASEGIEAEVVSVAAGTQTESGTQTEAQVEPETETGDEAKVTTETNEVALESENAATDQRQKPKEGFARKFGRSYRKFDAYLDGPTSAFYFVILFIALLLCVVFTTSLFIKYTNIRDGYDRLAEQVSSRQERENLDHPDWENVFAKANQSVVGVELKSSENSSRGSGILLDKEGHVATAYHVVKDFEGGYIWVTLPGNKNVYAVIVGEDRRNDLAILHFDVYDKGLRPAKLGSSAELKVGQPVATIASGVDEENGLSSGIIGDLHRTVSIPKAAISDPENRETSVTQVFQMDASLGYSNEGAPVFNLNGEVVGMAMDAFVEDGKRYEGLNYVVPIDLIKGVFEKIKDNKEVERPSLGAEIKHDYIDYGTYNLAVIKIKKLDEDSPLKKIGLKEGDAIAAIDGRGIVYSSDLYASVNSVYEDTKLKLKVVHPNRESEIVELPITPKFVPLDKGE